MRYPRGDQAKIQRLIKQILVLLELVADPEFLRNVPYRNLQPIESSLQTALRAARNIACDLGVEIRDHTIPSRPEP